ncbi:MAG TPA: hypothetical protein VJT31_27130, partial [Rugosimonospora sp.]|nr:hypothetical protein [Rugosimonospora sp.]
MTTSATAYTPDSAAGSACRASTTSRLSRTTRPSMARVACSTVRTRVPSGRAGRGYRQTTQAHAATAVPPARVPASAPAG